MGPFSGGFTLSTSDITSLNGAGNFLQQKLSLARQKTPVTSNSAKLGGSSVKRSLQRVYTNAQLRRDAPNAQSISLQFSCGLHIDVDSPTS